MLGLLWLVDCGKVSVGITCIIWQQICVWHCVGSHWGGGGGQSVQGSRQPGPGSDSHCILTYKDTGNLNNASVCGWWNQTLSDLQSPTLAQTKGCKQIDKIETEAWRPLSNCCNFAGRHWDVIVNPVLSVYVGVYHFVHYTSYWLTTYHAGRQNAVPAFVGFKSLLSSRLQGLEKS